jgi:hypothetical protein
MIQVRPLLLLARGAARQTQRRPCGDTAVQLQIKLLDPAIHATQRPYRARAGPPWQWPAAALPLASRAMK